MGDKERVPKPGAGQHFCGSLKHVRGEIHHVQIVLPGALSNTNSDWPVEESGGYLAQLPSPHGKAPHDRNATRHAPTPAMRALPLLVLGVLLASAPPVARADRDMCV